MSTTPGLADLKIWLIDIPPPLENALGSRLITGCRTVVVTEWVEWLLLAITSPTRPPPPNRAADDRDQSAQIAHAL
jgi:hypothetical protein